jgi:hypothetical protein
LEGLKQILEESFLCRSLEAYHPLAFCLNTAKQNKDKKNSRKTFSPLFLDSFHHGNSMHCKLFQESENQIIGKERKHKMNGINLESYLMIKSAKETKFRSKILTIQNDLIE